MAKSMEFINKHRWKIYLLWLLGGFLAWTYLGNLAWEEDPDAPGGIYIFSAWVCWFLAHVLPVIILAIGLKFWRWKKVRRLEKNA
ncbi:hypothetical protein [Mixta calida]|uniref:hypothetical protein n=1 Tax=Mixta calida TaxID=665913 RepID=UPI0034D7ADA1